MAPQLVLVIGAGPAGLTASKTLLHYPRPSSGDAVFSPLILEASDTLGGTFEQRSYENGNLVSSKQLTAFSDCAYPSTHRARERE
jgi:dimethylaniline monooxygenase (N-oxide forming)